MIGQDVLYWLWLADKCGVASRQFDRLVQKYENPFNIYRLESDEIEQLDGISDTLKTRLCEKDLEKSYDILKYCKSNRVDIVTYADSRYPERLKNTQDPPILLYCKGHFPNFNQSLCLAMVGTREMSEYGKQSAYKIAYELAAAGALIVSGMARGVDAVAASAVLTAGGKTVAVLGCGIDTVYPKQHKMLMEQIARHGSVITEYPPKEPPYGHNFPKRNRIISGLCQGVVVAEAPVPSGALITAKYAIEQGREVFAIPGKINDAGSEGPNSLICGGAYPVLSAEDVLRHYEFLYSDIIDKKKYLNALKNAPDADKALEKYGIYYAIGSEPKAKPQKKQKVEKKQSAEIQGDKQEKTNSSIDSGALASLDETTRKILDSLPYDKAVSADAVCIRGVGVSETITALTMLELYGLVASLPGGLYIRK